MRKTIFYFIGLLLIAGLMSCGNNEETQEQPTEEETTQEEATSSETTMSEDDIKEFLYDIEGSNQYGWETENDDISIDFFKDGRLHIQGPDGEATMWQGSWELKGDQLTMERTDLEETITVTVKVDGEKLILGDKVYTRNPPFGGE